MFKANCQKTDYKQILSLKLDLSVKTCGPPRIDDAVMSNMTVKPGQKVVFNCKVVFLRIDQLKNLKLMLWFQKEQLSNE